jgi:hypothetical protein
LCIVNFAILDLKAIEIKLENIFILKCKFCTLIIVQNQTRSSLKAAGHIISDTSELVGIGVKAGRPLAD